MISVIIPTYNSNTQLRQCLRALHLQTVTAPIELIVVDNGSTPPAEQVCAEFPAVRCIVESQPGSYCARNAGRLAAHGEILAFTDADCIPRPDWLANSLKYFSDPSTHAIGGEILVTTDRSPKIAETYERLFSLKQRVYVNQLGFAATANLLVRAEIFDLVGPFDDRLLSGGDYDWCRRLQASGYSLKFAEDVAVLHPARASVRSLIRKRRRVVGGRAIVDRRYSPLATTSAVSENYGFSQNLRLLIGRGESSMDLFRGWAVLALKMLLGFTARIERVRLALGGRPLR